MSIKSANIKAESVTGHVPRSESTEEKPHITDCKKMKN